MLGWIVGIAVVGLGWLGYRKYLAANPAVRFLDFAPFTLKSGMLHTLRVLAPVELDDGVKQMFVPSAAEIAEVTRDGGAVSMKGPAGEKAFQAYKVRLKWLSPDAVFAQETAVKKMGLSATQEKNNAVTLAAALYAAASVPAGQEARLRFFPIAIIEGPSSAGVG